MRLYNENTVQLFKFALIGLSGIFVNFVILFLFLKIISEEYALAFAIIISISNNYVLNRMWTFESKAGILKEYIKYVLGTSIGSLVQYFGTLWLYNIFLSKNITDIHILTKIPIIYFANLIGISVGFILNFIISKKFVFNRSK